MKAFDSRTSAAPAQRMEGSRSQMPPAFNPTTSETQDHAAPDSLQHLEEEGMDLQEKTQPELTAINELSAPLNGEAEDVLTEEMMTMNLAQFPHKVIRTFKYGGVQFYVIDVGGDENAHSRTILNPTITMLTKLDTHDYQKHPATKTVRLYIGDYKAMRSFADANPQLPYRNWKEQFCRNLYSGENIRKTKDSGMVYYEEADRVAQGFVSSFHDRSRPLEKQSNHYAAFMDMSQIDQYGVDSTDPLIKQAYDLALFIAHEGTHTLNKDAKHTDGLMEKGVPRRNLEAKYGTTNPQTGKREVDLVKYVEKVKELLQEFGKPY